MRALLMAIMILVGSAAAAMAGPREEALAVLDKWGAAFAASDVDAIVSLYAPDALFMGTGSTSVVTDTRDIRKYFEGTLLTDKPRGAPIRSTTVMVLADDAVLVVALNDSTRVKDGATIASPGRVTFVIAKRGDGWKIVHMHRSAMPK